MSVISVFDVWMTAHNLADDDPDVLFPDKSQGMGGCCILLLISLILLCGSVIFKLP